MAIAIMNGIGLASSESAAEMAIGKTSTAAALFVISSVNTIVTK